MFRMYIKVFFLFFRSVNCFSFVCFVMNVCLPFLPTDGASGAVDGEGGSNGQAGVHTHGREQGWESLGVGSQEGVRRLLRSSQIARQVRKRCPKDFSVIDAGYFVCDLDWRDLFCLYQRLRQVMLSTPNYGLTCLYIRNWRDLVYRYQISTRIYIYSKDWRGLVNNIIIYSIVWRVFNLFHSFCRRRCSVIESYARHATARAMALDIKETGSVVTWLSVIVLVSLLTLHCNLNFILWIFFFGLICFLQLFYRAVTWDEFLNGQAKFIIGVRPNPSN